MLLFYHVFRLQNYNTIFDGNIVTRLSAVAERTRDASCLSVVSFNSTVPPAHSFIITYFGFRFINAYN